MKPPISPEKIQSLCTVVDESLNEDTDNPDLHFLLLVTTKEGSRGEGSAVVTGNVDDDEVLDMLLLHSLHVSRAMGRMVIADKLPTKGNA